ncbi:MAG: hypothetical protein KJ626_09335 [Verrucomicrobia bacterium]|nr:hypothetical protein [Verrucomicrobiota bacterium]
MRFLLSTLCIAVLLAAGPVQGLTNGVRLTLDVSSDLLGENFHDDEAVSLGPNAAGTMIDFTAYGVPERVGIDALMVYSNRVVFSGDVDFYTNAEYHADEDLLDLNVTGGTFTAFWNGDYAGIPRAADVDAACFVTPGGQFLFSIDITTELPGAGTVTDDDVIRWNGAFSKAYDGQTNLSIPPAADIDGLYLGTNNVLYFSLDTTATINGYTGQDEDVWAYDIGSAIVTLAVDYDSLRTGADVVGLDKATDSDSDWLTDFEEITGLDEPGITIPGTATPVDPEGSTSNPNDNDTDDDGASDGEEAVAGTNPRDGSDLLKITQIDRGSLTNLVAWSTKTNRTYILEATTNLVTTQFAPVETSIVPVPGSTNTVRKHLTGNTNVAVYRVRVQTSP